MKRLIRIILPLLTALILLVLPTLGGRTAMAETTITSIVVTNLDAPAVGKKPDYDVSVNATGCYKGVYGKENYTDSWFKNGVYWYDLTDDKPLMPTDTFAAGHQYRVVVAFISRSGYTFYSSGGGIATKCTINGNQAQGTIRYAENTFGFIYEFPALSAGTTVVSAITITELDPPAVGSAPDYSYRYSPSGKVQHVSQTSDDGWKSGVLWSDETDYTTLSESSRFAAGHSYMVWIQLTAQAGYRFGSGTTVTINGSAARINWDYSTDNHIIIQYAYAALSGGETVVSAIAVTEVDPPVAGNRPDYDVTVTATGCYKEDYSNTYWKNGVRWRDTTAGENMKPTDTFVEGHQYIVQFSMINRNGYTFYSSGGGIPTKCTVNGLPATEVFTYDDGTFGFSYEFPAVGSSSSGHLFPVNYHGFATYNGGLFYAYGGDVVTSANGVVQDPKNPSTWYFCANGQVQTQYTGLAEYDGEWFYLQNGVLDTDRSGPVTYNGGTFMIAAGRLLREYTGLMRYRLW